MTTICNCATLILCIDFPIPNTYKITDIYYQENPLEHIPEGCSLLSYDYLTFQVELNNYQVLDPDNTQAVMDSNNIPLYLIGSFSKQ
ncbi:hypothetical protein LLG34_04360 [bacterium]|nr:hypothetical protein [bacterium]